MPAFRPALLHALGQLQRAAPAAKFALASMNPERAQKRKLAEILERNKDTEFGRAHGFASIRTPKEFAERVPVMTPNDLAPYVTRQMNGERNVLTQDPPVYYVRTTGSTGAPKHVPITQSYRNDFQKTVHVALFHLYARFPEAFFSTAIYFVGSRKVAVAPDGCDVGTMSGFNFTELPPVVRGVYAWPYELFEVKDLKSRTYLSLLLACLADPSLIAGIFPAPIVYLLRELSERCADLSRDIRQGTLPAWLELTDEQRVFFRRLMRADFNLAERLMRAAGEPPEDRAGLAWPSLKLVYCWTTATAALYLPELQRLLPGVTIRDAIYSACEGWASIPVGEEAPGGALALDSLFFEFIEEKAFERGDRRGLFAWELEDNTRYVVLMTTHAGLYRYLLGDIVETCGLHHQTPRIRFVRKVGATSNLAGEKLEEEHVSRAVGDALAALGLSSTFFTLAPLLGGERPGYALHFEAAGARPQPEVVAQLEQLVDKHLGLASFDYARLRSARQLEPVSVVCLSPGSYDAWRQMRVKEGSAEAQLKVAHLVADPRQVPTL